MASYEENAPSNNPPGEETPSLAARRAKLRGSLSKAVLPPDQYTPATAAAGVTPPDPLAATVPAVEPQQPVPFPTPQVPRQETAAPAVSELSGYMQPIVASASPSQPYHEDQAQPPAPAVPGEVMELLNNIDQSMSACATNLAALQKIASEQIDVLKTLTDTLQNQTLNEIGLNLNSLTESLSAALEPMKAAGELVPVIDQLVATLEASHAAEDNKEKITPDLLVTNLADQLSTGAIDPWTFKCAYTAIFPADHPADLLRRLVELLGTQRLSGDLFRAAYEAVQAAEPPPRTFNRPSQGQPDAGTPVQTVVQVVQDEEIKQQLEELHRANEELRRAMQEREEEIEQLLAAKDQELQERDQELQETQELLNAKYEEFNARYEEVAEELNKREQEYTGLIENKTMALSEKESELEVLRKQLEDMRQQFHEMGVQLTDLKIAAAEAVSEKPKELAPAPSFFDTAPPSPGRSLFDAAPEKPLFPPEQPQPQPMPQPVPQPMPQPPQPVPQPVPQPMPQQAPQPVPAPVPQPMAQQAATQAMPAMAPPQPVPQPQPAAQAIPNPMARPAAATPFTPGTGSYGSGVRAQVFEVIVRQALAGAPWREICAGPMQVNNITPDEVEAEVKRRQAMLGK